MIYMKKIVLFLFLFSTVCEAQSVNQYIAQQGQMTFFSYTSVENIKAQNDQVQSLIDINSGEIAVSILIKAFKFEKSLMEEHFNESYMESDLFPKASFEGRIIDFDGSARGVQSYIVKGNFTLKEITLPQEFKITVDNTGEKLLLQGEVQMQVKDFNIKIPALLSPNIAKNIQVKFNLEYVPREK